MGALLVGGGRGGGQLHRKGSPSQRDWYFSWRLSFEEKDWLREGRDLEDFRAMREGAGRGELMTLIWHRSSWADMQEYLLPIVGRK